MHSLVTVPRDVYFEVCLVLSEGRLTFALRGCLLYPRGGFQLWVMDLDETVENILRVF